MGGNQPASANEVTQRRHLGFYVRIGKELLPKSMINQLSSLHKISGSNSSTIQCKCNSGTVMYLV